MIEKLRTIIAYVLALTWGSIVVLLMLLPFYALYLNNF
tara:strand:+ start:577 stop:690 length:114 start_codon:yes stop_codon:yes gene_type:complete